MAIKEAMNRGNNLLGVAIVALSGFAFFPEFFVEDEWWHKLDEGILFLLGIGMIWWYLKGKNKYSYSLVPVIAVMVAFVVKLIAVIFLERGDVADLGDDYGAVILFALASILMIWLYKRVRKEI